MWDKKIKPKDKAQRDDVYIMYTRSDVTQYFGFRGGLAQLGEHLLCKQGVVGSIPSSSTTTLQCKQKRTQHVIAA